MFGFGSFFNMLYPTKQFLNAVLPLLKYDPSTYDLDELSDEMQSNEKCELKNAKLNVSELNKNLKSNIINFNNISIKNSVFVFKRNFIGEKTIISLEDIDVDIFQKVKNLEEVVKEEEKEKKEGGGGAGLLDNVINSVVQNLEVYIKNIKIKLFDKENKEVLYTLFIKDIYYKEASNLEPIDPKEKINYLFLHNKSLNIEGVLLKEGYKESDDIFFINENSEDVDEENITKKLNFIIEPNVLLYIKNKVELDITHDKDNKFINIGNDKVNYYGLFIESIFNFKQFQNFYNTINILMSSNNNTPKEEVAKTDNQNDEVTPKEKPNMKLFNFEILNIFFSINLDFCYFIIINNREINDNTSFKNKFWMNIKNLEVNKEIDRIDILTNYFSYLRELSYVFYISNLSFQLNEKKLLCDTISFKIINPNNNENKLNKIEIKKPEPENKPEIIYNKILTDYISNIVGTQYEYTNILNIEKLDIKLQAKEISYNIFYFYFNNLILEIVQNLKKLTEGPKSSISRKNNKIRNIDNNKNDEPKEFFKINGKELNLKLLINDNNNEYLNFLITDLNINNNDNKSQNNIIFNKINLTFYKDDKSHHLIDLLNPDNSQSSMTLLENKFSFIFNYKIIFFINPSIINIISEKLKSLKQSLFSSNPNNNNVNDNSISNAPANLEFNNEFEIQVSEVKIVLLKNDDKLLDDKSILQLFDKNNKDKNHLGESVIINLNNFTTKGNYFLNNACLFKGDFELKSIVVEDNIKQSRYKKIMSCYDFKNDNNILFQNSIEIQKDNSQFLINTTVNISPILIYLDQYTLLFIIDLLKSLNNNNNENNNNNNIVDNNSQKNDKFLFNNIKINNFSITFNYYYHEKLQQFDENSILGYLNKEPYSNVLLNFLEYNENNKNNIKQTIINIARFYLLRNSVTTSMKILPVFKGMYSLIEGSLNIIDMPIYHYKNNKSVMDGLVLGVKSCVANTFNLFGVNAIKNYLNSLGCRANPVEEEESKTIEEIKNIRRTMNSNYKDIKEYYFK